VAQKVQTLFIDDIDGSAADGTVRFGLDGTEYEIDLNTDHPQALRDALAPYKSAARRVGSNPQRPARASRKAPANGVNPTEVREWVKAQGIEVKDRGRVPPSSWSSSRQRPEPSVLSLREAPRSVAGPLAASG
jgi:Lsr2